MSLNLTAAWLQARLNPTVLFFGKTLATASTYLQGPGGMAVGDYPLPRAGVLRGLTVFDGFDTYTDSGSVAVQAGDRIGVYATYLGNSTFSVAITLNSIVTSLSVSGIHANEPVEASVDLVLKEDA